MSMLASRIGTVPSEGFDWYVFFIEWEKIDGLREQIENHFTLFGKAAGEKVLAVRGYDPEKFRESILVTQELFSEDEREIFKSTSLLITDTNPATLAEEKGLENHNLFAFPLQYIYERDGGDISKFLNNLLTALHEPDAIKSLKSLEETRLKKIWGWLSKYPELQPGIGGFKVDLKRLLNDLIMGTK